MPKFEDPQVADAFSAFPDKARARLLHIRNLIFEIANAEQVGDLEETLKWGQPSYLTPKTKAGSTIRLGLNKTDDPAVFTHCQTTIVSSFRNIFPDTFTYDDNRAVYVGYDLETDAALSILIKSALTYHRDKLKQGTVSN